MLLLSRELLTIAKEMLLNSDNNFAQKVGALYLIYGLYYKQDKV